MTPLMLTRCRGWIVALTCLVVLPGSIASAQSESDAGKAKAPPAKGGNPLLAAKNDPFVGAFEGEQLSLSLALKPRGYVGAILLGGQQYEVLAKRHGQALKGTFSAGEQSYAFEAAFKGQVLELSTDGAAFALKRRGPAPPTPPTTTDPPTTKPNKATATLDTFVPKARGDLKAILGPGGPDESTPAITTPGQASAPLEMGTIALTNGLSVRVPKAWRVAPTPQGIYLMPHDVEIGVDGKPRDLFMVGRRSAAGATRPDEPAVIDWMDRYMDSRFPTLKRTGEVEPLGTLAGPGAVLTYTGVLPDGSPAVANCYLTVFEGHPVYLMQAAHASVISGRRPLSRRMFSGFGWGLGAKDPALVGYWLHIDNQAGLATKWHFKADGTFVRSTMKLRREDQVKADPTAGRPSLSERPGVWFAEQGSLAVVFDGGGAEKVSYQVTGSAGEPGNLRTTSSNGKSLTYRSLR